MRLNLKLNLKFGTIAILFVFILGGLFWTVFQAHPLSMLDFEDEISHLKIDKTTIHIPEKSKEQEPLTPVEEVKNRDLLDLAPDSIDAQSSLSAVSGFGSSFGGFGPAVGGSGEGSADKMLQEAKSMNRTPLVLQRGSLEYPLEAKNKGISGYVLCRLLIREDGSLGDIQILESVPANQFDRSVFQSLRSWKFQAGLTQGQAVPQWITQRIRFSLE